VHHGWGVIAMPARVSSSARTAAAISSLPTSTPLQSKMITGLASARLLRGRADLKCPFDESALEKTGIAAVATVGRPEPLRSFLHNSWLADNWCGYTWTNVARKPLI